MKSLPGFAGEAYLYLLKNNVFFSIEDVVVIYKSGHGYVSFCLRDGYEVRVYDDGSVKLWYPGVENGLVVVEAKKEEVRAGEI